MAATLGADREAVVARELTKTFETVRRARLAELAATFAAEPEPKGEIVILAAPPRPVEHAAADLDRDLTEMLDTMPAGEAAATLAARTGLPRRDLYQRVLALKKARADGQE
jgi:16S rRNA (cytidine1402-2'-O)-methyltransferase